MLPANQFPSDPPAPTESRKRKRKLEAGDQDHEAGDSAGSTVRCPVKKHECHLYDLYRSKWWVPYVSRQLWSETRVGVLWLELNAVHILNCHVDDWKMRTSRWDLNHLACCCHIPGVFSFAKISPSVSIPPNSLVLLPQPTIVARSPGPFLRSAGPRLRPGRPVVVYFNSSGEADPGEAPHPSPPGQGCLHGQTLSGGRRGRCGRCGSRGSRITVSAAGARMTSGSAPRLSLASHPS